MPSFTLSTNSDHALVVAHRTFNFALVCNSIDEGACLATTLKETYGPAIDF